MNEIWLILTSNRKMDKSWMTLPITHDVYRQGIMDFVTMVYQNANGAAEFYCPCSVCRNGDTPVNIGEMSMHLYHNGMWPSYTVWDKHGEAPVESRYLQLKRQLLDQGASSSCEGPIISMLHDSFPYHAGYNAAYVDEGHIDADSPTFADIVDDDYRKYERLLEEA